MERSVCQEIARLPILALATSGVHTASHPTVLHASTSSSTRPRALNNPNSLHYTQHYCTLQSRCNTPSRSSPEPLHFTPHTSITTIPSTSTTPHTKASALPELLTAQHASQEGIEWQQSPPLDYPQSTNPQQQPTFPPRRLLHPPPSTKTAIHAHLRTPSSGPR